MHLTVGDTDGPDESIPTRQSLLSRLKDAGDQESWSAFFDTYWKLIYRAAVRAGLNHAEAQDVVQETISTVCRKMPGFSYDPAKGSFKAWLLRQTSWRISDQFRKRIPVRSSRRKLDDSTRTATVDRIPDSAVPALEQLWDREWEKALLEAAMQRVKKKADPRHWQIFDLCARKEWDVSRVAGNLEISRARVYLVKHRIGRLVKKELEYLRTKPL